MAAAASLAYVVDVDDDDYEEEEEEEVEAAEPEVLGAEASDDYAEVAAPKRAPKKRSSGGGAGSRKKPKTANVTDRLSVLDKPQLLELVEKLLHQHPELESELAVAVPRPDLEAVRKTLDTLSRKVSSSFPHAKYGGNNDTYAYRRVYPAIAALKKAILDYSQQFVAAKMYDVELEFLAFASDYAYSLPKDWKDEKHKKARTQLLKRLDGHYKNAIKNATLRADQIQKVKADLNEFDGELPAAVAAIQAKRAA